MKPKRGKNKNFRADLRMDPGLKMKLDALILLFDRNKSDTIGQCIKLAYEAKFGGKEPGAPHPTIDKSPLARLEQSDEAYRARARKRGHSGHTGNE